MSAASSSPPVQFQPAVPPHVRLLWGAAQDAEAGHQWGQRGLRHALTPPVGGHWRRGTGGGEASAVNLHLYSAGARRLQRISPTPSSFSLSGREVGTGGTRGLFWEQDSVMSSLILLNVHRISCFCKKKKINSNRERNCWRPRLDAKTPSAW